MEDAATAEISRSQTWQWLHQGRFARDRIAQIVEEEVGKLEGGGRLDDARELFEQVALGDEFVDFLTIPAYDRID